MLKPKARRESFLPASDQRFLCISQGTFVPKQNLFICQAVSTNLAEPPSAMIFPFNCSKIKHSMLILLD